MSRNEVSPAPQPRRRGRLLLACGSSGLAGLVVGLVIGLAAGGTTTTAAGHASPAASAAPVAAPSSAPAPAPSPVPSPDATGTGSCDVSLSPGLNGPNYLVSDVDVTNTGNVGAVVKVKVSWPQVGFAPIVKHKTVSVPYGQTVHVNLSVNANNYSSDIIGNFQNYQLSHNGDPCSYNLTIESTFGQAH
ncbi:MAG TPA: hypothetical protein VIX86_07720 [Streptosporangiaceae bacterium]